MRRGRLEKDRRAALVGAVNLVAFRKSRGFMHKSVVSVGPAAAFPQMPRICVVKVWRAVKTFDDAIEHRDPFMG